MGDTHLPQQEGSSRAALLEAPESSFAELGKIGRVADELIGAARSGAACHAALAQLRNFAIDEPGLETLREHAERHSAHAGCAAMYLAARIVYAEQLKTFLDNELEGEVEAFGQRFKGTFEADALRHGLSVLSDYASAQELEAAAQFFSSHVKDEDSRQKVPHFQTLSAIAQHRASLRSATSKLGTLAASLQKEGIAVRSVVLSRLSARY